MIQRARARRLGSSAQREREAGAAAAASHWARQLQRERRPSCDGGLGRSEEAADSRPGDPKWPPPPPPPLITSEVEVNLLKGPQLALPLLCCAPLA